VISKPLGQAVARAEAISKGDLSSRLEVTSADELGRLGAALNDMAKDLEDRNSQLLDGVNILSSSGTEISATVAQLVAGASRTSEAVTETTATVEEVKQAAKLSSDKAKDVAQRSREATQVSESGQKAMEDTIAKMDLIKEQTESIGETVVRLTEQSEAIEVIISSVQDIADQSNLLAVNASIEAARAGEHGKGFSVVAQEIKNLADQSKGSTQRVRAILDETRRWINAMVKATEQANRAVDDGVEQSVLAGESIRALTQSVSESSQAANLIATSSEQQFVGVDQVSSAMISIEQAITHNFEGTSYLEDAVKRLEELGRSLKELVQRYKT